MNYLKLVSACALLLQLKIECEIAMKIDSIKLLFLESSNSMTSISKSNLNDAFVCETYTYDPNIESGVCQVLTRIENSNSFSHKVRRCLEYDETCDYLSSYKGSETIRCQSITNGIPGDVCRNNFNCKSKMCILGVCDGKLKNGRCTEHEDCNRGLACVNNKCLVQQQTNSNCRNDYECVNNNGCYNEICIPYFSLVEGVESQYSKFCQSRFAINGFCREIELAQENPSSNSGSAVKNYICQNPNEGCRYVISKTNLSFFTNCVCSLGNTYQKFCPLDNSPDFNILTEKLRNSTDLTVHTTKRFNYNKLSIDDRKLYEFPKYEGLSEEVIRLLSKSYFILTGIAASLLILLY